MAALRDFDRRRQALMPEPHWYLLALGTDPAHQRQGHGSQLVRHGHLRADRDGMPVYLEAETAINAPFYERLGFRAEGPVFDEVGIPHVRMSLGIERRDGNEAGQRGHEEHPLDAR
jgi:GNAT superfamily N-acetyltransferase